MSAAEFEPPEVALARSVQADLRREFHTIYDSFPESELERGRAELAEFLREMDEIAQMKREADDD
jgi:hypothetical protein